METSDVYRSQVVSAMFDVGLATLSVSANAPSYVLTVAGDNERAARRRSSAGLSKSERARMRHARSARRRLSLVAISAEAALCCLYSSPRPRDRTKSR